MFARDPHRSFSSHPLLWCCVLLVAACGDDGAGAGGGPAGAGGGGGEGSAVEGRALAIFLNVAPEDVTLLIDGPTPEVVVPASGRVELALDVDLRACDEGLCARWDFQTLAGPSEVAAVDGDVIAVLGPQSAEIVRSRLDAPQPGHAVVGSLASPTTPQVSGSFGWVDAAGTFVAFDLGFGSNGQQVPADAVLAFRHLDGGVDAFGGAFEEGVAYGGFHLHGAAEGEVRFHLCALEAAATCEPYLAQPRP